MLLDRLGLHLGEFADEPGGLLPGIDRMLGQTLSAGGIALLISADHAEIMAQRSLHQIPLFGMDAQLCKSVAQESAHTCHTITVGTERRSQMMLLISTLLKTAAIQNFFSHSLNVAGGNISPCQCTALSVNTSQNLCRK